MEGASMATETKTFRLPTLAGSGSSTLAETRKATEEAIGTALKRLGGVSPSFAFLFVAPRHDLGLALSVAERALSGAALLGSTTAGEITERGLTRGGVSTL